MRQEDTANARARPAGATSPLRKEPGPQPVEHAPPATPPKQRGEAGRPARGGAARLPSRPRRCDCWRRPGRGARQRADAGRQRPSPRSGCSRRAILARTWTFRAGWRLDSFLPRIACTDLRVDSMPDRPAVGKPGSILVFSAALSTSTAAAASSNSGHPHRALHPPGLRRPTVKRLQRVEVADPDPAAAGFDAQTAQPRELPGKSFRLHAETGGDHGLVPGKLDGRALVARLEHAAGSRPAARRGAPVWARSGGRRIRWSDIEPSC